MITEAEWESIYRQCEKIAARVSGTKADFFVTGKVLKVDIPNKCIFMDEFGEQPIPVVGFAQQITYYDTDASGVVHRKNATVEVVMPTKGQTVLVAREMGTSRLPRCLGVIQGTNWIIPEEE